jgi:hypothetical protein
MQIRRTVGTLLCAAAPDFESSFVYTRWYGEDKDLTANPRRVVVAYYLRICARSGGHGSAAHTTRQADTTIEPPTTEAAGEARARASGARPHQRRS